MASSILDIYREKRPPNDDAYFENMTRVIFQAGLSWKTIDKKWPNFKRAFKNFSIEEMARFRDDDVDRLMNDTGIIRNRRKIMAAIHNARQFRQIIESFGSF